jgi:hypothetical protein
MLQSTDAAASACHRPAGCPAYTKPAAHLWRITESFPVYVLPYAH